MADALSEGCERSHANRTGTSSGPTVPMLREDRSQFRAGDVIEAESGCRYEILEKLGQGGMAEVYRARATKPTGLVLDVALKCLRGVLGEDEESERQFMAEARISSGLGHPNIARVSDLERIGGRLCLVLEFVDGVSLKAVIRAAAEREEPMPAGFACYVGACIADALHHANTLPGANGDPLGIVHRDLAASNVMVTRGGIPKLLDFGIAYARIADRERTRTGVVRGTYSYLSPEQAAAGRAAKGEVDGRSDLFSLGLLLVELLTGEKVFRGEDEYLTARAIEECSPTRVQDATRGLSADLQRVCRKLLARSPADRYQRGDELALELRAILADREPLYGPRECVAELAALGLVQLGPGETSGRSLSGRGSRPVRARRLAALVIAALVVGAGAGALAVRLAGAHAPQTAPRAEHHEAAGDAVTVGIAPPASAPQGAPISQPGGPIATPSSAPVVPSARTAIPDLGWPDGVPIRKRQRAERTPKQVLSQRGPTAPPAVTSLDAAAGQAASSASTTNAQKAEKRSRRAQGALLQFADRGIVANANATLPRGTVLRVRLSSSITTAAGERAEAVVTEDVPVGKVVVPRGALVTCRTGSMTNGRLSLSCDEAREGERVWVFSGLALGEGDRTGLRVEDAGVAAGVPFTVCITASAIVE